MMTTEELDGREEGGAGREEEQGCSYMEFRTERLWSYFFKQNEIYISLLFSLPIFHMGQWGVVH